LELTARIGKELLAHNQKLETTVNALETELKEANEKITQLNHEVLKKTELIQILTNDVDESSSEAGTPTGLRGINLELLQRKVTSLEDENKQLRGEFAKLVHEADNSEEQEAQLVKDIAAQLGIPFLFLYIIIIHIQMYIYLSSTSFISNIKYYNLYQYEII
jgi:trafficking kinesin-binding protein 1